MKKIVIAFGVVMAACALHAATYTWGFSNGETVASDGKYFGEGSYSDASAFLYLGTVTLSDGAFNFGSATQLASVQAMDTTNYNWGDFTAPGTSSSDSVLAAGGQAYTLILVDKGGITDLSTFEGNAIVASGTSVGKSIPGAGETVYFASFQNDTAYTASAWNPVSAPEPTSGLLLLLGMAGLALRRKHA